MLEKAIYVCIYIAFTWRHDFLLDSRWKDIREKAARELRASEGMADRACDKGS